MGSTSYDLSKFNALIAEASDAITCNSDCQKEREAERLKQSYLDAETNVASSDAELSNALQEYVVYTQGSSAYTDMIEAKLQDEAEVIADTFSDNFNADVEKIQTQIDSLDTVVTSYDYAVELLNKYLIENKELFNELKDDSNDVLTNERKTYYENQQIDNLKFYYLYFLIGIYVICVVCFVIFCFIYPSQMSGVAKLLTVGAFIALPFLSTWILGMVIFLANKAYNVLPKNVYKNKNF
jgi:hypothetical protein